MFKKICLSLPVFMYGLFFVCGIIIAFVAYFLIQVQSSQIIGDNKVNLKTAKVVSGGLLPELDFLEGQLGQIITVASVRDQSINENNSLISGAFYINYQKNQDMQISDQVYKQAPTMSLYNKENNYLYFDQLLSAKNCQDYQSQDESGLGYSVLDSEGPGGAFKFKEPVTKDKFFSNETIEQGTAPCFLHQVGVVDVGNKTVVDSKKYLTWAKDMFSEMKYDNENSENKQIAELTIGRIVEYYRNSIELRDNYNAKTIGFSPALSEKFNIKKHGQVSSVWQTPVKKLFVSTGGYEGCSAYLYKINVFSVDDMYFENADIYPDYVNSQKTDQEENEFLSFNCSTPIFSDSEDSFAIIAEYGGMASPPSNFFVYYGAKKKYINVLDMIFPDYNSREFSPVSPPANDPGHEGSDVVILDIDKDVTSTMFVDENKFNFKLEKDFPKLKKGTYQIDLNTEIIKEIN